MKRNQLPQNTSDAFRYVQNLYDETAALIRELESYLNAQPEHFIINQPYGVAIRGSKGLEPSNTSQWLYRKLGVLFVPRDGTSIEKSQTVTPPTQPVLYFRFVLDEYQSTVFNGESATEPVVLYGTFTEVTSKKKSFDKFEKFPSHFEYRESKVFDGLPKVDYEDTYIRAKGEFGMTPLFNLDSAEAVTGLLAKPALALFRSLHQDAVT